MGTKLSDFMKAYEELTADDIATLLKADPKKSREIMELWDDPDDNSLTEKEVPTGPRQAASGDGAEEMIDDYSNPAKQEGLSEAYEELGRRMFEMGKSIKAIEAGMSALLSKAEEDEDEEEEHEKEAKKAAKAVIKQINKMVKSQYKLSAVEKALIATIKKAEEDEDEESKKEAEKALKAYRAAKAEDAHLEDEDTNQADEPADVGKAESEEEEEEHEKEESKKARRKEHEEDEEKEVEKSKSVNKDKKPGSMAKGNASLDFNDTESVLAKARTDLSESIISQAEYNEIAQLVQLKFHIENGNGNLTDSTFAQMLAKASEPAVRYFQ